MHPLAQGVNVVAVSGANVVAGLELADNTSADSLLAAVQMDKAKHLSAVVHLGTCVLKEAAEVHVLVQVLTLLTVNLG